MAKKQYTDLITPKNILFGAVGAFLLYRLFKSDQSGGTSDENISYTASNLTYSNIQYKIFADEIEAAVWGTGAIAAWWEDDEEIGRILMEMQNIDDVKALISAYGRRYAGVLLQEGGNLVQTIENYLDDDIKEEVNEVYKQSVLGLTDIINDKTGMPYTKEEALQTAKENQASALGVYNKLLSK